MLNQQFGHLHPVSSYQRRNFSLSILQLMATTFTSPAQPTPNLHVSATPISELQERIPAVFVFSEAVTEPQAVCLLEGLQDPYDANRKICLDMLYSLPISKIQLNVRTRGHDCVLNSRHAHYNMPVILFVCVCVRVQLFLCHVLVTTYQKCHVDFLAI